ncbi:MAG: FMN-binding protein [Chloroflexi bacterium]|nr:FMN-binding protein [Chloroflexota bacterium]
MPSHRMPRGLVALSASAVAAIYMAGYLRTQAADASIAAAAIPTAAVAEGAPVAAAAPSATPPPAVIQRPNPATSRRGAAPASSSPGGGTTVSSSPGGGTQASTAPATSGSGAQTQAGYKDGTYTGQGTSRRGDVWVSVQIQGGRVANVTITRSTLQYPLRDIADLPSEVVQRQSAQVDIVSRATYSSMAFRGAVTQALSAAQSA